MLLSDPILFMIRFESRNFIMERLGVYISIEERPIADEFLKFYDSYSYQGTLETKLKESKYLKKQTAQCRFCKRKNGEVTFNQDTHLLSRMVGNSGYYSHDECDECNKLFNSFETSLAAALGYERTFNHLHPTQKAPGFESGNGNIGIKKLGGESFILYTKKDIINDIKVDFLNGKADINILTQSFIPVFVYRAILKMGLAILPDVDIPQYDNGFKFLLEPDKYPQFEKFKNVIVTETKINLARPFAILFRKKESYIQSGYPEHVFCLYTNYFMFQIALPGYNSINDIVGYPLTKLAAPYIQLNAIDIHDNVVIARTIQDLNSTEKFKRDVSMHTEFSTENLVCVDVGKDFIKQLLKK
jgi:hypothetical protein